MSVLQAVVLGVIQGITEFLPISSSGHLIFIPTLFGWVDQGVAFDVMVHLGSLVAVVVYFRKRLWSLVQAFFSRNADKKLVWFLIASIVPAGVVGLWMSMSGFEIRSPKVVACSLIVWAIALWFSDKMAVGREKGDVSRDMNWKRVLVVSCAQALALIPGTSRSGITMTAGMFSGLSKTVAAEFSFLMSVPVIFLAGMVKFKDVLKLGEAGISAGVLFVGFLAAALSGFVAIWGLMRFIQSKRFTPFVVYRVVIGVAILLFLV